MKLTVYIFLLLLPTGNIIAQQAITGSVNPLFKGDLDGDKIRENYDDFEPAFVQGKVKGLYNQVTFSMFHSKNLYIHTALNANEKINELEPFRMPLKPGQGFAFLGPKPNYRAVTLFDSMPVVVTAYGINEKNKGVYRFRVLENGKREIVSWQEPRLFSQVMIHFRYNVDGTEQKEMAYLGEFHTAIGNSITVEVKNILLPDTVYSISAVWLKRAPKVIGIFEPGRLKELMDVYKFQWKYDAHDPKVTYYGNIELTPVDSLLVKDTVFNYNQNSLFLYVRDKIRTPALVEYNLVKDHANHSKWLSNQFDPNIIWLKGLDPGTYTLLLRYAFQRETVSAFRFKINPAWYQTPLFKVISGAVLLLFIALVFNFFKTRKQQKLVKLQTFKRQKAETDLQSIRSQFNPHFVFNALNSIQGLIQKGDTEDAEKYLSDFSLLMRESLHSSNTQMISLDRELKMLINYIELEKLRFGFDYQIEKDKQINVHAIEFPALLLQPLVENAVKHGISGKYGEGVLKVAVISMGNDMKIEIIDNGKGFDSNNSNNNNMGGYGIRLTTERAKLLSEINPAQPVSVSIESSAKGTTVTLIFKNWLI